MYGAPFIQDCPTGTRQKIILDEFKGLVNGKEPTSPQTQFEIKKKKKWNYY